MMMYVVGDLLVVFVVVMVFGGFFSVGGVGVFNYWYDCDIDVVMVCIVDCFVFVGWILLCAALIYVFVFQFVSFVILWVVVNLLVVVLVVFGFVWYMLVYIVWLKCRSL